MKKDIELRLLLEKQIMDCWNVTEDIRYISDLSQDARVNTILIGLKELYDLKFMNLFGTFEALAQELSKEKDDITT